MRSFLAATMLGATLVAIAAGPAVADAPPTADELFERGRTLITQGQVADACAAFEQSMALDPALGTRLNLGLCWEQLGRVGDAIRELERVVAEATTAALRPFGSMAGSHLEALYARQSAMVVTIAGDAEGVTLWLTRAGASEQRLEPGTKLALDPSRDDADVITVIARRGEAQTSTELRAMPGQVHQLRVTPPAPAATAPAPDAPPATTPGPAAGPTRRRGLYVAGAGVLALGASAVVGLVAKGRYDDAVQAGCTPPGDTGNCSEQARRDTDAAISLARWGATPLAVLGVAAVAAGTVLWFRDRRAPARAEATSLSVAPVVTFTELGLAATGTF